jgi:hypothetical protein
MDEYTVIIAFDDEAQKWYAQLELTIIFESIKTKKTVSLSNSQKQKQRQLIKK